MKLLTSTLWATLAIPAFAQTLFEQSPNLNTGASGGSFSYTNQQLGDSFVPTSTGVPGSITAWGSFYLAGQPFTNGTVRNFRVQLLSDSAGPSTLLFDQTLGGTLNATTTTVSDFTSDRLYKIDFDVSGMPTLNAGTTYWLSVYESATTGSFRWHTSNTGPNSLTARRSSTVGWSVFNSGERNDVAFRIVAAPVPEPATLAAMSFGIAAIVRRRKQS